MTSFLCLFLLLLAITSLWPTHSFTPLTCAVSLRSSKHDIALFSSASSSSTSESSTATTTTDGLQKRDRYVVMNRFAVRKGQEAKFEKRWATRKSRLAQLRGFRYFHIMRRVELLEKSKKNEEATAVYKGGETNEEAQENYVSFTIWERKSDFSVWRKGDAFKEAHGGTSIGAFLSTMVNSAMVLRGPPRPAFYDGLQTVSVVPSLEGRPLLEDGWRKVEADGINLLPAECFVVLEKHYVNPEFALEFEQKYGSLFPTVEPASETDNGLVVATLLRRDGQAKGGHGASSAAEFSEPNYVSAMVWKNLASALKGINSKHDEESLSSVLIQDSERVMYEGTLVISSELGP